MTSSVSQTLKKPKFKLAIMVLAAVAVFAAVLAVSPIESANSAPLIDPANQPAAPSTGPAQFYPAPNPNAYCPSSFVFDPWPTNQNPTNQPQAVGSVETMTTGGVTATMTFTQDNNTTDAYPGTYNSPDPEDQTKGFEFAGGNAAEIVLSKPLFYSQWVFTDVDRVNEGFILTPNWATVSREVALMTGQTGDPNEDVGYSFTGSDVVSQTFTDTYPATNWKGYQMGGRVQVDYYGAISGLNLARPADGAGQSGFAIVGGCTANGAAKRIVGEPVWDGTKFTVTYELRVRNNLPSSQTLNTVRDYALAASPIDYTSANPQGINLSGLALEENLADTAGRFSSISVVSTTLQAGSSLVLNSNFDGLTDTNVLDSASTLAPETEQMVTMVVDYVPELTNADWQTCSAPLTVLNQTNFTASADGVAVNDLSDDGIDSSPASNNGAGGVDDPTVVSFPCDPELKVVKTVVSDPAGCPATFAAGTVGAGTPLQVTAGDTVYYCIAVRNDGTGPATGVTVTDPMLGLNIAVGDLAPATEQVLATQAYVVPTGTTGELTNTATATGTNTAPVNDTAVVTASPPATATPVPSATATPVPSATATPVPSATATPVPSATATPVPSATATPVPSATATPVPSATATPVPSATATPVPTSTATPLPTSTATPTPTSTPVPPPGIDLEKTVLKGANAACETADPVANDRLVIAKGEPITWCFKATNTGQVALKVTTISDADIVEGGQAGIEIPVPAAQQRLEPGESVVVSHNSVANDSMTNTASVTGTPVDETDTPIPGVDGPTATDTSVLFLPKADVAIEKVAHNKKPVIGTDVTYTLTVKNNGPDEALDVTIIDTLHKDVTFKTLPTTPGWACSMSSDAHKLTCVRAEPLAAGATEELSYVAHIWVGAINKVDLPNTAKVTTTSEDPDPTNNIVTVVVTPPGGTTDPGGLPRPTPEPPTGPPTSPPAKPTPVPPVTPPVEDPDEPLNKLAYTGSNASIGITTAAAMLTTGSAFIVAAMRRREEDQEV